MNIRLYDPKPYGNEYATFFFQAMMRYGAKNGMTISPMDNLMRAKDCIVIILTDHLSHENILMLKNSGCKIVGFNVTDSSYLSGHIRYVQSLHMIDLIYTLSGLQMTRMGKEMTINKDFQVELVDKEFLDEPNWKIYRQMVSHMQIQSLPYVPWTKLSPASPRPYRDRSQKVIIRGGGHARRFILSLFLMRHGLLDTNSGMVLQPYFADSMNPQFRYCDDCRKTFRTNNGYYAYNPPIISEQCNHPCVSGNSWTFEDVGQWNNRCPRSFYWMAEEFQRAHGLVDMKEVAKMLNANWLHPQEYMDMLSRITFTSDYKWAFSIFAPQRFWEAASAGCVNILPDRTSDQQYFPMMEEGVHYLTYNESLEDIDTEARRTEETYNAVSTEAADLYERWIKATDYPINTNLLAYIFDGMQTIQLR